MNKENLANAFIDGALSDTATSVDLKTGYVAYQPTTPYFATITPFGELSTKANSEIVEVTNKSGDTLTIVRGQRGTTAKNFSDGAIFSNGIYVEDLEAKLDTSGAKNALSPDIQFSGGRVGIGKVPASGRKLDVNGDIYSNGSKVAAHSGKTIFMEKTTQQNFGATTVTNINYNQVKPGYDSSIFEFSSGYSGGAGVKIISSSVELLLIDINTQWGHRNDNFLYVYVNGSNKSASMMASQESMNKVVVIPVSLNDIIQIRTYSSAATYISATTTWNNASITVLR